MFAIYRIKVKYIFNTDDPVANAKESVPIAIGLVIYPSGFLQKK